MSCGYYSTALLYVVFIICITFELVNSAGVTSLDFCNTCWYKVLVGQKAVFKWLCVN